MKPHFKPPCTILATALAAALHAAVPLAWEVTPNNPAPAAFDRHHGETIHITATFNGFGELPFAPEADCRLWYQTNGMGQAWWSAPATIQSNVLSATWTPALDPGADRVSLFFGAPSNVYASAVLRLRHSPGFTPSELTLPVQRLDFAAVELCNISALTNGWSFGTEDAVRRSGDTMSGSLTIGTRDRGVFLDPSGNASFAYGEGAILLTNPYFFTLANLENGRIVYRTIYYPDGDGQLALTSDIPTAPDLSDYARLYAVKDAAVSATNYTDSATNGLFRVNYDGSAPYAWGRLLDTGNYYTYDFGFFAEAWKTRYLIPYEPDETALFQDHTKIVYLASTGYVDRAIANIDIPDPDLSEIEQALSNRYTKSETYAKNEIDAAFNGIRIEMAGSNVWFVVTNYQRTVAGVVPSLQLYEVRNGVTNCVYHSTEEVTNIVTHATNALDAAISAKIPSTAWSAYQSRTGAANPQSNNVTIVSTPSVLLTGGGEWTPHTLDAGGTVWTLESNGLTSIGGTTNGYFRIVDAITGEEVFSVEERSITPAPPVNASFTVKGDGTGFIYSVYAGTRPTLYTSTNLTGRVRSAWDAEGDDPNVVVNSWTDNGNGTWTCNVTLVVPANSYFAYAAVRESKETVITHKRAASFDGGIYINGVMYTNLAVRAVGGYNVLTVE